MNLNSYSYHCKEWEEFYNENQTDTYGDNPDDWTDIIDLAQNFYEDLDEVDDGTLDRKQLIHFSAGVYLGLEDVTEK